MIDLMLVLTGLVLGLYSSYIDLKEGIVRNGMIFLSLLLGLVFNSYFVFSGHVDIFYFSLRSFVATLSLSFLLYFFEFVPSGDAKLLASFSLLVPPSYYQVIYPYIPSLPLFINSFLPLSAFLIGWMLLAIDRKEAFNTLKREMAPKRLGPRFLKIFSLSGVASFLLRLIGLSGLFVASGFFIVGLMTVIDRIEVNQKLSYIPLFVFTLLIMRNNFLAAIYSSAFGFLLYGLLRIFVMGLANDFFTNLVQVENIEPGMSLADRIVHGDKGAYQKQEERVMTIFSPIRRIGRDKGFLLNRNEGLTQEEVRKIRKLKRKDKLKFDKIKVHRTLSFAPFISAGFLLTVVFGRDIISLIISLL